MQEFTLDLGESISSVDTKTSDYDGKIYRLSFKTTKTRRLDPVHDCAVFLLAYCFS